MTLLLLLLTARGVPTVPTRAHFTIVILAGVFEHEIIEIIVAAPTRVGTPQARRFYH